MKATGIVRRIDELGRVVIPKEIRRTLRIREGDPLEIFVDREGGVILKKYSPIGELGDFAREYAESIHQSVGHTAVICDRDVVIAVSGAGKKELLSHPVSERIEEIMQSRRRVCASRKAGEELLPVTTDDRGEVFSAELIIPIISSGDSIGAVILLSREPDAVFSETDIKVCETAAGFMGKQMES
ncbi:MAG: stage V sporulation protein T [Clostridiales bacterium]|nr:stage V sporulation protein T [Clostridiales bacterium]